MSNNPLILVDGSSYIYRAFYAAPPLKNSKGEPTGALFGVINMIKSLLNNYEYDSIAVVFDAKGKSFRNDLFSEYKATRESMPEDLLQQIEPIHTAILLMGLPIFCVDGVEADDVIGTLTKQANNNNKPVLISTGDKDMAQLVNDKTTLINTMSNFTYTKESVLSKFGVPPNKIIDFLALMGDSSDNIPGVPGVGEKSAVTILSYFDGINDLYHRIDDIDHIELRGSKSIKQKLLDNKELAFLSYKLATIKCDVELPIQFNEIELNDPNYEELKQFFEYHGFNKLLSDLLNNSFFKNKKDHNLINIDKVENVKKNKKYKTILEKEALFNLVDRLNKSSIFAFDTETDSIDHFNANIIGISFCIEKNEAFYIPLNHNYSDVPIQLEQYFVLSHLKPIFENINIKKIAQNIKYDYSILANYNIDIKGTIFDTMLESYVLKSTDRHDLDSLAQYYLNESTTSYDELITINKKKHPISEIDIYKVTDYACEDADLTFQLHNKIYPKLENETILLNLFNTIEMPLAFILSNIERTGVLINAKQLNDYSYILKNKIDTLEHNIHKLAGEKFNIASPKQLQTILFDKNNLPVIKKTPKGVASTNEEVLLELSKNYELPKLIIEYRGLSKLKNTYTDALPKQISEKDNRIHTNYNQIGTITGRLSSNNPNLQNIPVKNEEGRKIRQAFISNIDKVIISADYSQIELRIMAHLSKDKNLVDAFYHNKDIHRVTASEILDKPENKITSEERRRAKAVNFGLIYGMSAFGLAKQINISRNEAQFYIDRYFERYPGVLNYMNSSRQLAAEKGYVETLSGRRLYLPKILSSNGIEKRAAERSAINAPMQGTAADIIKTAMIKVDEYIKQIKNKNIDALMIMQVHDELVFEVNRKESETIKNKIIEIMENCYSLDVPLKVEAGIGNNWDEAH